MLPFCFVFFFLSCFVPQYNNQLMTPLISQLEHARFHHLGILQFLHSSSIVCLVFAYSYMIVVHLSCIHIVSNVHVFLPHASHTPRPSQIGPCLASIHADRDTIRALNADFFTVESDAESVTVEIAENGVAA
jgi:hypothetical protein